MESDHALQGHPRSMSCEFGFGSSGALSPTSIPSSLETAIATTIIPATSQVTSTTGSPPNGHDQDPDVLAEASVPLPPSPPGSDGPVQDKQEWEHGESCADSAEGDSIVPEVRTGTQQILLLPEGLVEPCPKDDEDEPEPEAEGAQVLLECEGQKEEVHAGPSDYIPEEPQVALASGQHEEGPGLRTLGIPSDDTQGQNTPTQDVMQSFPLSTERVLEIFRQSSHEAKRCSALRRDAYHQLRRYGDRRKFAPTLSYRYQQLVRCHREDYADNFSSLYAEIPGLDSAQSESSPFNGSKADADDNDDDSFSETSLSWMAQLPTASTHTLLRLIDNIRTNEEYLAERIARLPPVHLEYLARFHSHQTSDSAQAARPFGARNYSRPPSRLSRIIEPFESLDDIRKEPLQVMLYSFFDWTADPSSPEGVRREKVWASVCSRLVNQDIPGAERVIVAILDRVAQMHIWKPAAQLETLIMEWIQSGYFTLDNDVVPSHKGEPEESKRSRLAVEKTRFIELALEQFLDLLVRNIEHAVPTPCLGIIQSALFKTDGTKRERAKYIFLDSWYCQSYLRNTLVCPELHGLLKRHHIRREMRAKIFDGIYCRLASTFEDVRVGRTSDNGPVSSKVTESAFRLSALFESHNGSGRGFDQQMDAQERGVKFLSLASGEMLSLLVTLFPHAEKSPDPSGNSLFGRAFSMTSSVAGGSRATTVGTLTPMFGTTSSAAPSTSSTSITSDTFFSDNPLGVDSISVGISEDTTAAITPGSTVPTSVDSKYIQAAREIRTLVDALESKKPSLSRSLISKETVSIVFLSDAHVSLQEPGPSGNDTLHVKESDCVDGSPDRQTLRETLHSTLLSMMDDETYPAQIQDGTAGVIAAIGGYLAGKVREAQDDYEFITALRWHKSAAIFAGASAQQLESILQELVAQVEGDASLSEALCGMYEAWVVDLTMLNKRIHGNIDVFLSNCKSLRDKQWFASVVCHSSEYRDALNIVRALATMATGKVAKQGGLAGWAKRNLKVSFGSERAQAQALATLSAGGQHGGLCKLKDAQAELTATWLTNNSIENFCGGEERIHRFCYEVQHCTRRLVADTMIASPVLWSSSLYEKEKRSFGGLQGQQASVSMASVSPTPRQGPITSSPSLQTSSGRMFSFSRSPPHSRQTTGVKDFASLQVQHTRSSILDSPIRFNTPPENALGLQTPWTLPPSPVSPSISAQRHQLSPQQKKFLEDLRQATTSLLLSDLGLSLWTNGSETDRWVNEERLHHESVSLKIGSNSHPDLTQLAQSPPEACFEDPSTVLYRSFDALENQGQQASHKERNEEPQTRFPYEDAYSRLLTRFRLSPDPIRKLESLYELVRLISQAPAIPGDTSPSGANDLATKLRLQYAAGLPDPSIPRTGLTKLQEVTINCEERRIQSLTLTPLPRAPVPFPVSSSTGVHRSTVTAGSEWLGDPKISNVIQALLLDRAFHPATLFRDLQMISAFVPSAFLDASPQGAAFWTMGLAAMQLKSALCAGTIDRAAQITNFHVDRGNKGREPVRQDRTNADIDREVAATTAAAERHRAASPNRNYQSRNLNEAELRATSLADAGRLFRIAALEGDPSAARELGLFYLTHPEHVRRTLRPLSNPSEVARMAGGAPSAVERLEKRRAGPANECNGVSLQQTVDMDDEMNLDMPEVSIDGRDPGNLATAWHWMESAADGGDVQAKTFLTNNTELKWDAQGKRI